jgi:hypothetical protein
VLRGAWLDCERPLSYPVTMSVPSADLGS